MDLQTLTYLFVGATFSVYIGIAIWARAGSTKDFYVAGGGVHPVPMVWPQRPTGCLLRLSSPWRA